MRIRKGRKRHIVTDTIGIKALMPMSVITKSQ